jgi:poly(hydroxyalkanoate) depolymerase family esterase
MRKISNMIARLAALRAQQHTSVPTLMTSDRLSTLSDFGSNPGALHARYYLSDNLSEGAPLVVVLHGCTQNAAGYDQGSGWSHLADEVGFALLYPQQQRANNPNLCFNWFSPADTKRDRGEALSIRQMIETMVVNHGLDRQRIFVTGLSAGGAMAAAMLATYPDLFAGGGIIAGLPYGTAATVPEAFDRMRGHGGPSGKDLQQLLRDATTHAGPWPRVSIWQGSADHTVAPANAEAIAAQWRGVHKLDNAPTHLINEPGRTRRVWCGPAGEVTIEVNMITGMGHGTPIGEGLGTPGPYILDVGITSTRELAQFWDIANTGASHSRQSKPKMTGGDQMPSRLHSPSENNAGKAQSRASGAPSQRLPQGGSEVQKIIEDALRAAGLMR